MRAVTKGDGVASFPFDNEVFCIFPAFFVAVRRREDYDNIITFLNALTAELC